MVVIQEGVSMSLITKIAVMLIVASCGMVIPTDKLINSSVNSSELSTVISNASDSFSASAPEGSLASGSGIFIQPGSLAVGTSVDISAAEDLVSSDTDILGTSDLSTAGPAVYFESSGSSISANPMTITLPISITGLNSQNLVVIYKVLDSKEMELTENENYYLGIIPTSYLTVKSSSVVFQTSRFGAYQVAISSEEITEETEVETPLPIAKIDIEKKDPIYGSWFTECYKYENAGVHESLQVKVTINEDNTYTEKQYTYSSNSCTEKESLESVYLINGKIVLGLPDTKNVRDINITPEKIYYSLRTDSQVNKSKDEKLCEISDWVINKFIDVTDTSCVSEDDTATYYTIIKATNRSIFMGNAHIHPADSPETRPTEIDLEHSLSRATN